MDRDEDLGGDPPCWAHLFDEPDAECSGAQPPSDPTESAGRGRDEFEQRASSTPA